MADEFDITSHHPDYDANIFAWETMRDAIEGEDCIKEAGERYLPMKAGIKAMTDLERQGEVYRNYVLRAEFPEIVAPTIRGSMGLIHDDETVIDLPAALEPLREKATKDGLTLQQLHRRATVELFRTGRFVMLPGIGADGEFHIATYVAESFINWDSVEGNLSYGVLDETAEMRDEVTNKWQEVARFRELYLDDLGFFVSRMWVEAPGQEGSKDKKKFIPEDEERATIQGQRSLDFLPLVTMGAQDLTVAPDELPLYGLAKIALRSYRLDADYVNALHMTSEPTPYVTGVDQAAAPKTIGAYSLWILPENATAGFLEFNGPGVEAQEKEISNTQHRAIVFGAQLFAENKRTAESGEAIKLRLGSQTSILKMISVSSAAGLEKALRTTAIWAGANPDEVHVEPNLDFIDHDLSPQDITALVSAWQAQAYSKSTLFENLQKGSIIDADKTFEEEEDLVEAEGPALASIEPEQENDDSGLKLLIGGLEEGMKNG